MIAGKVSIPRKAHWVSLPRHICNGMIQIDILALVRIDILEGKGINQSFGMPCAEYRIHGKSCKRFHTFLNYHSGGLKAMLY